MPFDGVPEFNPADLGMEASSERHDIAKIEDLAKNGGTKEELTKAMDAINDLFDQGVDSETITKLAALSGEIRIKLLDSSVETPVKNEITNEAETNPELTSEISSSQEAEQALHEITRAVNFFDKTVKRFEDFINDEIADSTDRIDSITKKYKEMGLPPNEKVIDGLNQEIGVAKIRFEEGKQKRGERVIKKFENWKDKLARLPDANIAGSETNNIIKQIQEKMSRFNVESILPQTENVVEVAKTVEASNDNNEVLVEKPKTAAERFNDDFNKAISEINKFKGGSMENETIATKKKEILRGVESLITMPIKEGASERNIRYSMEELADVSERLQLINSQKETLNITDADLEAIKTKVLSIQEGASTSEVWDSARDSVTAQIDNMKSSLPLAA